MMYVPKRNDIVWLDFEPTKGKEIGKYRPAFILSHEIYNKSTGLIICCPISTSIRGKATEVPIEGLESPSVVATTLVQTLDWRERHIKFIKQAEPQIYDEVIKRVILLLGGEHLLK
jgi:transcriptional modulator of mazE/toxin, mazF